MPEKIGTPQSAKHLAARAVVAYRAGIPVTLLSVVSGTQHPSIAWDWKGLRGSVQDDAKLLGRAFAFIYVGTIVDREISGPIPDDLRKEIVDDMSSALDVRQTAVDWGVAEALTNTDPFAHAGYKMASRVLRIDKALIESLALELTSRSTLDGDALREWLDTHASPLDFNELEASTTY